MKLHSLDPGEEFKEPPELPYTLNGHDVFMIVNALHAVSHLFPGLKNQVQVVQEKVTNQLSEQIGEDAAEAMHIRLSGKERAALDIAMDCDILSILGDVLSVLYAESRGRAMVREMRESELVVVPLEDEATVMDFLSTIFNKEDKPETLH